MKLETRHRGRRNKSRRLLAISVVGQIANTRLIFFLLHAEFIRKCFVLKNQIATLMDYGCTMKASSNHTKSLCQDRQYSQPRTATGMDGTLPHCRFENLKPVEITKTLFQNHLNILKNV